MTRGFVHVLCITASTRNLSLKSVLLGHIAAIASDNKPRCSVVGLSVCLLGTFVNPANTDGPIEMPFGLLTRMSPRKTTTTDDDRRQRPLLVWPLALHIGSYTMCRRASNKLQTLGVEIMMLLFSCKPV